VLNVLSSSNPYGWVRAKADTNTLGLHAFSRTSSRSEIRFAKINA